MDASSSPVKRRALGDLDPNASSSPKKIRHDMMKPGQKSPVVKPTSVAFPPPSPVTTRTPGSKSKKRPVAALVAAAASPSKAALSQEPEGQASQKEPLAKRPCLETPSQTWTTNVEMDVCGYLSIYPASKMSASNKGSPQSQPQPESRAASPAPSSVFDNSAFDHSQETSTLTEPDPVPTIQPPLLQPPSSAVRPRLTREQARQVLHPACHIPPFPRSFLSNPTPRKSKPSVSV